MINHKFKREFGQNFLQSSRFARKLVDILDISSGDSVFEIGPGNGFVTSFLIDTKAKVTCIEVDYDLIPPLIKKFDRFENFNIIHQDFLELELIQVLAGHQNIKFVGSLPYNISKVIVRKIDEYNKHASESNLVPVKSFSFIMQEEVVDVFNARPPKASQMYNIYSQRYKIKKLGAIPNHQFYPMPKVNGGILYAELKPDARWDEQYETFLGVAFHSPRKTLYNNLRSLYEDEKLTQIINGKIRASELSTDEMYEIFLKLKQ